ncbi:hypothetical protein MFLAVUS_004717 [Mucor flavus]|uniref:Uncharacterized protein n=1 Tax=Mucor flavus TaxID=439312 RepID=A0ABP9YWP6_9FUNG
MTRYFKLLNAFREDRENKCVAKFRGSDRYGELKETYLSISNTRDGTIRATYNLQDNDFCGPDLDLDLPDEASSTIGLEIFSYFDLQLANGDTDDLCRALNYVRFNCPNLQSFLIKCYELVDDEVLSCIYCKHQKGLTSSDPTHINTLELKHIDSVQNYLDILSTDFHHTESILLEKSVQKI